MFLSRTGALQVLT